MSDAAQGEPIKHEVFEKPFVVKPQLEEWETPENYRRFPDGKDLPRKLAVWRVQRSGKDFGSVVARGYGFEDSPDAEVLTIGYNTGKEPCAAGVGRQGNFLQWGFSGPPSQMTEAGKAFFLNCVWYIRKFDGQAPLELYRSSTRMQAWYLAPMINTKWSDPTFMSKTFPAELLTKYKDDPAGLADYYGKNIELVYHDKLYLVDQELTSLGLKSNRRIATLERLVALLADEQKAPSARLLLKRYTEQTFESAQDWQKWLAAGRGRIYFTDVGGFKFKVAPESYMKPPATKPAKMD